MTPLPPPRWITACALILSLSSFSMLTAGCNRASKEAAPAADVKAEEPPVPAHFERVQAKMLEQSIELSGTLAAAEMSEVASLVAGAVSAVHVDVGSRVKKGDPLIELDRRESSLRAAQASAQRRQAVERLGEGLTAGKFDPEQVPEVRAAKEANDLAQADAERTKALVASGAVSQAAWDQARTRAEQAKAQYATAVAGAKQAQAALAGASAATGLAGKSLSDTVIRAPFDGSVAERRISLGEYVTPGRVVTVVVSDNPLRLKIDVPEADIGKVKPEARVEALVVAYPGRLFEGKIKRIGASVRQQSRSLPVEAELPNDDGSLRPGMFVRVRMVVPGATSKALLVPQQAVGTTGASSRLFVKMGDRVAERLVVTGRRAGTLVEVIGEVKEGEEVAVGELEKLSDGAAVAAR
jgi:multidrug efflux pump subunit AcrA (membrane-fusion protein)